jgi:formiminoglutamase
MDIRLYLDSVSDSIGENFEPNELGNYIFNRSDRMPRWKDVDLAILGVHEQRGNPDNRSDRNPADRIRQSFYRLKKSGSPRIIDLGNLRLGETLEHTYSRLREVCEYLIGLNVLPIILGGSHDLDLGQYQAYEGMEKMIYLLNVDASIDMEESRLAARSHLNQILLHKPNYLFSMGHIAYQNYLTDPEKMDMFRSLHFDDLSLGQIRGHLPEIEPIIRLADMLSFDMTAVRQIDAPTPFGLSPEEACQIAWYAGLNEKLSSLGIYEYNPDQDRSGQTAFSIAAMLWYFIEGYYHRKDEAVLRSNFHIRYTLPFLREGYELVFYKSLHSDKWWMEVPDNLIDRKGNHRHPLIPCSYSDYQQASSGVLPDRWLKALNRMI